jgi:hypothetical protein
MHEAEHRRSRAGRERDGGDRDSREARAVAKPANGVMKIVTYAGKAVHVTLRFNHPFLVGVLLWLMILWFSHLDAQTSSGQQLNALESSRLICL